jgi:hypothetical protein
MSWSRDLSVVGELWQGFCLGLRSPHAYIRKMTNPHVIFEAEKVSQNWQIKCYCPGGKIDYVTGFLDEQSTQNWLKTEHCAHWLKVRGYNPAYNAITRQ